MLICACMRPFVPLPFFRPLPLPCIFSDWILYASNPNIRCNSVETACSRIGRYSLWCYAWPRLAIIFQPCPVRRISDSPCTMANSCVLAPLWRKLIRHCLMAPPSRFIFIFISCTVRIELSYLRAVVRLSANYETATTGGAKRGAGGPSGADDDARENNQFKL